MTTKQETNLYELISEFSIKKHRKLSSPEIHKQINDKIDSALDILKTESIESIDNYIDYIDLKIEINESYNNYDPMLQTSGFFLALLVIIQTFNFIYESLGVTTMYLVVFFIILFAATYILSIILLDRFKLIKANNHMYKKLRR